MDQDRPGLGVAHVFQHRHQVIEIVPVDRSDIVEAQLLEHGAAGNERAGVFLDLHRALLEKLRQPMSELLSDLAEREIGAPRQQPRQVGRHGAHRRRDRHVVVVENDDQPGIHRAGIVHGLVGHARGHGAVADHAHDVVCSTVELARNRHAEAGGDRGGGMRGTERVVFAFRPLGEAGQATALAQGTDAVAPPGQDFVRIALVPDIPDQAVARRFEHVMQGHRELDDPEAGTEMAAGLGDRVDQIVVAAHRRSGATGRARTDANPQECEFDREAGFWMADTKASSVPTAKVEFRGTNSNSYGAA